MDILLDPRKTLEQNAVVYFERAKWLKRKLVGVKKALVQFHEELANLESTQTVSLSQASRVSLGPLQWFEKFRWFVSSDGFLCVGGRDAVSNEIVVKKHTEKGDVVFHSTLPGSPFFVVKAGGKPIPEATLVETACATASFSRSWREGFASAEVYHIAPEQVTKTDPSGVSLPRGAFYIAGKKKFYQPVIGLAIGKYVVPESHNSTFSHSESVVPSRMVMCGHLSAVKKWCSDISIVQQGDGKVSDVGKKLAKLYGVNVDDIVRALPSGGVKIVKV